MNDLIADPIFKPGHFPTHYRVQGTNVEDPELKAIMEAARGLKDKPRCFRVEENIYSISDRVWKQISR